MSVSTNLLSTNVSSIETDTSGWTAGTSTSLSRSTARFYTGAASLAMKRLTTTGPASATTSARVAVTPGTQYTAYAYFANQVSVANRTATVRVDWWAASSGGTAVSADTSAAVTLLTSMNWTNPPPILVATAPAGATYASVTVTVTGMAVNEEVVVDGAAFGPPNLIDGNLLSYQTQGIEVGVSGWGALKNAAIDRTSAQREEGWWALQMTATAAGDMQVRPTTGAKVTPGAEYYAFADIYPPVDGAQYRAEIWWYDSANGFINNSPGARIWTPSAGTWTRCGVVGVAPPNAAFGRPVLRPQATAAGEVWLADQIALMPTPLLPGNALPYSAQSMELGIDDWSARQGCTVSTNLTASRVQAGIASLKITCQTSDLAIVDLATSIPVTPRHSYTVAPWIYHDTAPGSVRVQAVFTWYDDSGAAIDTSTFTWDMGQAAGWYHPPMASVAPSGAVSLKISLQFPNVASGTVFYVDEVFVGEGGLSVIADEVPDTRSATITVRGLTTITGTSPKWTLVRRLPDGTEAAVRGYSGDMRNVPVGGDIFVVSDYEAPLGVSVSYGVTLTAGSSTLRASASPLTLSAPEDRVVIKDPGSPSRSGEFVVQTVPDWQRSARMGVNAVRGRARPIVISDVRSSRTGSVTLVTETDEEADAMWWLLETGATLLMQWPADWSLSDMYVQVGDVSEARISPYAGHADRTWSLPLTEVDRPIGGMVGSATRTWQTIADQFATWADVLDAYGTWVDVLTGIQGT